MSDIQFEDCIAPLLWICVGIVIGTVLCCIDWSWLENLSDYQMRGIVGFVVGALGVRFLWLVKE